MTTIFSWNVNGLRAVEKKGFLRWLAGTGADVVCVQETKMQEDQLWEELRSPDGYESHWAQAVKKGYSGVGTYSRTKPLSVALMGDSRFDDEGRVLATEFPGFVLVNAYFPNSQEAGARLAYKIDFCDAVQDYCRGLVEKGKHIVLCGDYNVAHKPLDLTNPKANEKNPGYLPEERAWMDRFIGAGFVDTFRIFNSRPEQYTWWSYRFNAREKNIGWRIDYHCVDADFAGSVRSAAIHADVFGSDHCPVSVTISA